MRSTLLFVTATLVSTTVAQLFAPTFAQTAQGSYKIQKGHLDDGSKIHPSRPQIEILDETPIVKDRRKVEQQPTYEIVIPPLPGQSGANGAAGGPNGAAAGSGDGSKPGVIRITPTKDGRILAPPGYESNIPAGGMRRPNDLPSGTTTGVHALMKTPQTPHSVQGGSASPRHGELLGKPAHQSNPTAATYTQSPSSQGATNTRTTTNLKGEVKDRGKLLH